MMRNAVFQHYAKTFDNNTYRDRSHEQYTFTLWH